MAGDTRRGLVEVINHPLGFFVLALLIIETFIGVMLIFSDLEKPNKYIGMWCGLVLFLILIVLVFVLVWFKPKNLTFGERSHLKDNLDYGMKTRPITQEQWETIKKAKSPNGKGKLK